MNLVETPAGRRALFTGLYFVEGAPIGFLWWALPTLLTERGVGPELVGALLGWLVLPWAFKWLWAPAIDRFERAGWSLRRWIVSAQVGMALTLLPLLLVSPAERPGLVVATLLLHALFASTQDAAIDALMIRVTPPGERGLLAGWMQAGMLGGRSLLGGGALLVHDRVGADGLVAALLGVLVLGLGLSATYRAPLRPSARREGLGSLLRSALGRRTTWLGLAFAATAGAGFEALGGFAGPLLTEAAGGGKEVAGRFFLVHAVLAMAVGGLLGGRLADRRGPRRASGLLGLLLGAAVLGTAARLAADAGAGELVAWLSTVYLAIGAFTAASYALFMAWTDARLAATQFSAYMGATNLCESWSIAAAGRLVPGLGYGAAIASLQVLALSALLLLRPSLVRPGTNTVPGDADR